MRPGKPDGRITQSFIRRAMRVRLTDVPEPKRNSGLPERLHLPPILTNEVSYLSLQDPWLG